MRTQHASAVKRMFAQRADVAVSLQQFFYKERRARSVCAPKLIALAGAYKQLLPPEASGGQIADACTWEVSLTAVDLDE